MSDEIPQIVLPSTATPRSRVEPIDLLRGTVMILMVLDHTRDFFGDGTLDPTDLSTATPALFLTRWVTHFCAPVFAFLAGSGVYLAGLQARSRADLARYLVTRGLWLIFLEVTVVRFGLFFNPMSKTFPLLVLWSIGGSFLLMSGMVFLPSRIVGVLGVLLLATHAQIDLSAFGSIQPVVTLLLRPGFLPLPDSFGLMVGYPLLPWFGVVAAGYGFAEVFQLKSGRRSTVLVVTGLGLTLVFVAFRIWASYGEPRPWSAQRTPVLTALSFLNCTKYPPSPLYLLMTLGPAIMAMGVFDWVGVHGRIGRAILTLGRVPLFFYILQWYVIHGLAVLTALIRGLPADWLFAATFPNTPPSDWPTNLLGVYAAWAVMLALLYVPCRWFADVKRRHREGWLSYL